MSLPKLDKSLWGGAELDRLLLDIRERRDEFEQQRFISPDIIERYKAIGVYRSFVPKEYGGDERTPAQFLQLVETIAAADGSAGWVASFGMNPAYLSSLPPATVAKVWANGPNIVFAGGIFPPMPAVRKDGGFLVYNVANSKHSDLPIATDLIISDIAKRIGFLPLHLNVIHNRNGRTKSGNFLRESVVIMRK